MVNCVTSTDARWIEVHVVRQVVVRHLSMDGPTDLLQYPRLNPCFQLMHRNLGKGWLQQWQQQAAFHIQPHLASRIYLPVSVQEVGCYSFLIFNGNTQLT